MIHATLNFINEPFTNKIRVGTDCSGIEAPIQALRNINIPFKHVFASDIDKYCIESIKGNYKPERLYGDKKNIYPDGDIRNRDNSSLPDIDLYISGFPCQPFSIAGSRKGFNDKRGNVFWSCLDVIKTKEPTYFVLENVKGLLWHNKEKNKDNKQINNTKSKKYNFGKTFQIIWNYLQELKKKRI